MKLSQKNLNGFWIGFTKLEKSIHPKIIKLAMVHLRLGRVSNLPTVWSNCIAAWALAQGNDLLTLGFLTISMTLIYTGGMYLNDACDAEYDAATRRERPIPSGEIKRTTVYIIGFVLVVLGIAITTMTHWMAVVGASLLVSMVVAYDFKHKLTELSPFLMGGCRAMIYLTVGWAAGRWIDFSLLVWAILLGLYVSSITFAARDEDTNKLRRYAPLIFLLLPAVWNFYPNGNSTDLLLSLLFLSWLVLCLFYLLRPGTVHVSKAVANLLAGITLVDLLAVSGTPNAYFWFVLIACCFGLTLSAQRYIPAT